MWFFGRFPDGIRFKDDLIGKIDLEESTWELEKNKKGGKELLITLVKAGAGKNWKCVGKKEADIIAVKMKKLVESGGNSGEKGGKMSLLTASLNELNPDDNLELAEKNERDEKSEKRFARRY